jgi:hypothetical protein
MTRNHLRQQAGGNPAQGPAPDLANPTPGPSVGGDFPDAPKQSASPEQDQPDLDAFAERIGIATADDHGDEDPITQHDQSGQRNASNGRFDSARSKLAATTKRATHSVAAALGAASERLHSLADRRNPS